MRPYLEVKAIAIHAEVVRRIPETQQSWQQSWSNWLGLRHGNWVVSRWIAAERTVDDQATFKVRSIILCHHCDRQLG
jgi:hypothetical protein